MKTRKVISTSITSREDLEKAVGEVSSLMLESEKITVAMEARLKKVREEYEVQLATLAKKTDAKVDDIAAYVQLNPGVIPADRKSLEMVHGTIGFRTGMPRVLLPRGVDEADLVTELFDAGLGRFVRTTQEVDKQAVINAGVDVRDTLAVHGVRVTQSECFFVSPRRDGDPAK